MQIALLIFCSLTIIGAFSAWRKSPLYSVKATLKLIGAFVLILAVIAGTIDLIVNGSLSRSPVFEGVASLVAVLVVGCGSSVLIVRITDAHVAALPSAARLVSFNRHKIYRWIGRLAIFLLINAVAALALPSSWQWLPVGLGGFVLVACGPMLSIAYMMARRNDRGMSAVIANPWAHWQYAPEQWAQWAENQRAWEKAQEHPWNWTRVLLFILFCGGLFVLGALFTGASLEENSIIVGGLTGSIVLLALVAYWFDRTNFDRRYRRLLKASPESWFGDEGVFANGTYTPWILSGRYLLTATAAIDQPARLMLVFESFNGSSSTQITQRIPIPDGHLTDLPVIEQKLNACCKTASVNLSLTRG